MDAINLPVYAIVEILIRASGFYGEIGKYQNHVFQQGWVVIKTSKGMITFSNDLVAKQFEQPGAVTNEELLNALATFEPHSSK